MNVGNRLFKSILTVGISALLASCSTIQRVDGPSSVLQSSSMQQLETSEASAVTEDFSSVTTESTEAVIYHGTGKFIAAPVKGQAVQHDEQGDITLNFHNTDIHEVIKVVLLKPVIVKDHPVECRDPQHPSYLIVL